MLFPYTTLFRSVKAGTATDAVEENTSPIEAPAALVAACNCRLLLFAGIAAVAKDRKSTRLNSSHMSISYAVFCLKKKRFFILALIAVVGQVIYSWMLGN